MTLDLSNRHALHGVWNALTQYIDNNDPEDLEPDERRPGVEAEYAAVCRMAEAIDAHVSTLAE